MKRNPSQKSLQTRLESMCGQIGPDDGQDPREFFKPDRKRRASRKDWQLCRQVFETLNYVLSGECHDNVLRDLIVIDVVPAPDANRLLVNVCPLTLDPDFKPVLVLERLQQALGRLRSEVARSISRRKVPELTFRVVLNDPPSSPGAEVSDD